MTVTPGSRPTGGTTLTIPGVTEVPTTVPGRSIGQSSYSDWLADLLLT